MQLNTDMLQEKRQIQINFPNTGPETRRFNKIK